MTALQLQLLIAVARTLRDMAANPLASVGTARLSEALAAVEERYGEPHVAAMVPEPAAAVLRRAEEALLLQVSGNPRAPLEYGTDDA